MLGLSLLATRQLVGGALYTMDEIELSCQAGLGFYKSTGIPVLRASWLPRASILLGRGQIYK